MINAAALTVRLKLLVVATALVMHGVVIDIFERTVLGRGGGSDRQECNMITTGTACGLCRYLLIVTATGTDCCTSQCLEFQLARMGRENLVLATRWVLETAPGCLQNTQHSAGVA